MGITKGQLKPIKNIYLRIAADVNNWIDESRHFDKKYRHGRNDGFS